MLYRRSVLPIIVKTLHYQDIWKEIATLLPVALKDLLKQFLPRVAGAAEIALATPKQIPMFNMLSFPATPLIIEELAQDKRIEKIYLDRTMYATEKVPDLGIYEDPQTRKKFTTTYWCYSEDTEVLTRGGFRRFHELNEEEIATLNPKTHELEYQKPKRIVSFNYDGYLYHFKGRFIDLLVTPNHRMYVRNQKTGFKFRTAEELAKKFPGSFEYKRDSIWRGEKNSEYMLIPQHWGRRKNPVHKVRGDLKPIPMNIWLKFLGWYLSEGSIYESHGRITITQKNEKNSEEIIQILKTMGLRPKRIGKNINAWNIQLVKYLKRFGKCREKYIPEEIKRLPPDKLKILLASLLKGDGRHGGRTYDTVSKKLAEDVAEIVLKCGYGFTISKGNPCISIGISKVPLTPKLTKRAQKSQYQGKVWCIEVPNGIFYVGRNGRYCWSGNTKRILGLDQANIEGNTGKGVVVSIIDTGAGVHEQIPFVERRSVMTGLYSDGCGHGTCVATILGGKPAQDTAFRVWVSGAAPHARLISIKALGYIIGVGKESDILEAMELSAKLGVDIVNMSLGSEDVPEKPEEDPQTEAVKKLTQEYKILVCCAAGNSGPGPSTINSPGVSTEAITVGAWDEINGDVASFSSRGPTKWGDIKPDFVMPGVNVDSGTVNLLDLQGDKKPQRYSYLSGTCLPKGTIIGNEDITELQVGKEIPSYFGRDLIIAKWYRGVNRTYKIFTTEDYEIEATPEHRFLILRNGELLFMPLSALYIGDEIVCEMPHMRKRIRTDNQNPFEESQFNNGRVQNKIPRIDSFSQTKNCMEERKYPLEQREGNDRGANKETIRNNEGKMERSVIQKKDEKKLFSYSPLWRSKSILWKASLRGGEKEKFNDYKKIDSGKKTKSTSIERGNAKTKRKVIGDSRLLYQTRLLCSSITPQFTGSRFSNVQGQGDYRYRIWGSMWESLKEISRESVLSQTHLDKQKTVKVRKIIRGSKQRVYDITTLTHNFVANGLVVHNSMACPHLSGLLACARQLFRTKGIILTSEVVKDIGEKLGKEKTSETGWGLLAWDMIKEYFNEYIS